MWIGLWIELLIILWICGQLCGYVDMWTTQKLSTQRLNLWIKCERCKQTEMCGGDQMKQATIDVKRDGRATRDELLAALEATG